MAEWIRDLRVRLLLARIKTLHTRAVLALDKRDRLRATVEWLKGLA